MQIGGAEFCVCLGTQYDTALNESTLPLCSKYNSETPAIIALALNRVPVFKMDTSLGTSRLPGYGDTVLKTFNFDGSSNDLTSKLNRGDFVRVGHPYQGEVYRVSSNNARLFNSQNLPLASVRDPSIDASLSYLALNHATFEVQDIIIKSPLSSVALTPSGEHVSGFRLKYKSQVTSETTAGGAPGCLRWDGSGMELEKEL